MDLPVFARVGHALITLVAVSIWSMYVDKSAEAGVRGRFDFPLEVVALPIPTQTDTTNSEIQFYEITIPVSFRTSQGSPRDVMQIEIELTLGDEKVQIVAYDPQTSLAGDIVGDIEETVTTEDTRNWRGSVGASIPIPGLKAAQIGPSADIADTERTVRTEKIRRRPKLDAVVVAGNTARGRGVFFQLRPAPDVTLEGAQHLTLQVVAPRGTREMTLTVKCRAVANEDWLLFTRQAEVGGGKGHVKVIFPGHAARGATDLHVVKRPENAAPDATPSGPHARSAAHSTRRLRHTDRPCPLCDEPLVDAAESLSAADSEAGASPLAQPAAGVIVGQQKGQQDAQPDERPDGG